MSHRRQSNDIFKPTEQLSDISACTVCSSLSVEINALIQITRAKLIPNRAPEVGWEKSMVWNREKGARTDQTGRILQSKADGWLHRSNLIETHPHIQSWKIYLSLAK